MPKANGMNEYILKKGEKNRVFKSFYFLPKKIYNFA